MLASHTALEPHFDNAKLKELPVDCFTLSKRSSEHPSVCFFSSDDDFRIKLPRELRQERLSFQVDHAC